MSANDGYVLDTDPDAVVLQTIEDYSLGRCTREDVLAAIQLAAEVPTSGWRYETLFRRDGVYEWLADSRALDAMLSRVLSRPATVRESRSIQ